MIAGPLPFIWVAIHDASTRRHRLPTLAVVFVCAFGTALIYSTLLGKLVLVFQSPGNIANEVRLHTISNIAETRDCRALRTSSSENIKFNLSGNDASPSHSSNRFDVTLSCLRFSVCLKYDTFSSIAISLQINHEL